MSDLRVKNQSNVSVLIRGFLCPTVGLASFLETNFHTIKLRLGTQHLHSGGDFLRSSDFVSGAYYSPRYRPHCMDKEVSAFKIK